MAVVAGAFMCICRSYSSSSCRIFSYLYRYNSQHSSITLSDYAENADEAERRQQRHGGKEQRKK